MEKTDMKVIINFFDYISVLKAFSRLYKLSENEIMRLVVETTDANNPTAEFIRKSGIKLDAVDIKNVWLHCKHITTITDNFYSLKQFGLLTLDKALTFPTPLSKFLMEHEIEVDVVNRDIYYKSRKIHILKSDEECKYCFYGTECQKLVDFTGEPTFI
jgi:hypothetical protein